MAVSVTIDAGRIARLLRVRNGPVARKLADRTRRTAQIAAREAPGTMGQYITWRVEMGPRGLQGVIVCDHPATPYVLNGTRPHIIRPRRAKALRFKVGPRTVFAAHVRHPGTAANNFLARALRLGR